MTRTVSTPDTRDPDHDGITTLRVMTVERDLFLFASEVLVDGRSRFVWVALQIDDRPSAGAAGAGARRASFNERTDGFRVQQSAR